MGVLTDGCFGIHTSIPTHSHTHILLLQVTQAQDKEFQRRIGRIEGLVHQIEQLPDPNAQATAQELMQLLLELHSAGLERMLDLIFETGTSGQALIDELAKDDLVSNLLLLHGLHPLDLETRVLQA